MWHSKRIPQHALLACLLIIQFRISYAGPQQAYYNSPNGQLQLLNNAPSVCGECPPGTQRETVYGPYCGRCNAPSHTCAAGYYMVSGRCQPCPCPGTNGGRRFGTSCRVEADGQVTCDCPSEYTGRDCSQCAPGAMQNNQYPYNCIRQNSTNSFQITCPSGNLCNSPQIPQIVQQRPNCGYTNQPIGNGCSLTNQTGLCPSTGCQQNPCQSGGCPGGTPCQSGGGCQGGTGTPCQTGSCQGGTGTPCQTGGCQGGTGTPCQNGGCQGGTGTPCQNGGCQGGTGTPCQNGGCQGGTGTPCQTGGCQGGTGTPCQNGGCQGGTGTPCQNGGCQGGTGTPCQNGGCQGGTGTPCQNGGSQGGTGIPCQTGGCQGGSGTPCQNGGCQGGTGSPCPIGPCPQKPCPENGNGCPGKCPGNENGGSQLCPCPNPCGCPPNGCPGSCPGVTQRPPVLPPWTTPTPSVCPGPIRCPPPIFPPVTCPGNPCNGPGGCSTCPGTGCPINPTVPCQSNCPNPCSACPQIPPCPNCELKCPACPDIPTCPPCKDGQCQTCPNPCQPCPNPCQTCPKLDCPDCVLNCTQCPICNGTAIITPEPIIEPCICDPRGTVAQIGTQCICKVNVQGSRCDQCKAGYFGLSSSRPEGCLACFCSGLSSSCSLTPYYRATIRTDRSENCTVELTDQNYSIVYSKGSPGYTWDGQQALLSKATNTRLFWSLPSCLKGDRVTSYGGLLSFSRMCSGSGSSLGADHEVMLVGGSGATVFWTTFEDLKCDGSWTSVDVLLAESAFWSSWKGEQYRRATRGDILEVLADLQLLLIRATFTSSTMTTAIRNVSLSTVSHSATTDGVAMQVESCRCPTGYRGLSCENCEPGYYRDITDMTKSVFGTCKPCPCGKTSDGCHLSAGQVVCKCKSGFSGPLCQDKEVITITCDPFRIREVEGSVVDFTCSFTTNSKRRLLMRLGKEGNPEKAEETTSLTKTIKLVRDLRRVACEVVDNTGVTWAVVYCSIELIPTAIVSRPPPPRLIAIIPAENFMCVEETGSVTMTCDLHNFGPRKVNIEWRREGSSRLMGAGRNMTILNAAPEDAGTYICSASDGEVTGAGQIALMVRRNGLSMRNQYPVNATGSLEMGIHERHGGDYPNYPYQMDQADSSNSVKSGNRTEQQPSISKIDTVLPGHPKATVDPVEVKAKPGDTVILRCNATGQEPLKFYWKSGTTDYIPVHVRISHGALIFRSLRSQDVGVYYCVAWNHLGQSTARASIILDNTIQNGTSKEKKPDVEILHPEILAKPGENVNFQCRSNQTGVKYVWSRVGQKMPNSSEIRTDGLLTLYRVRESDTGKYICTVTKTDSGETTVAQAVLKLKPMGDLLVPPRVTIRPKSPLRVRTGEKVKLECESNGSPMPNVTWVRSIDGTEKKLTISSSNKAIYEIKQMSPSDVGKYACNAVSSAGKISESMSLVIDDGKQCKENEFRCKSGNQCIPRAGRCDSEKDCKDGSDEDNCKSSRRIRRRAEKF